MSADIRKLKRNLQTNFVTIILLLIFLEVWFDDYSSSLLDEYFNIIRASIGLWGAHFIFYMIMLPAPSLIIYLAVKNVYYDHLLRKKLNKSIWKMKLRDYF